MPAPTPQQDLPQKIIEAYILNCHRGQTPGFQNLNCVNAGPVAERQSRFQPSGTSAQSPGGVHCGLAAYRQYSRSKPGV